MKGLMALFGVIILVATVGMSVAFLARAGSDSPVGAMIQERAETVMVSCPTMHGLADEIAPGAQHMRASSSAEALALLRSGEARLALVGRAARSAEREGHAECILAEGVALIIPGETKTVDWDALGGWRVHTTLPENRLQGLFPPSTEVIRHETSPVLTELNSDEALLIDWDAFADHHGLLIPLVDGEKDPRFRRPTLYGPERLVESYGCIEKVIS